jgi:hypothetical protein
MADKQVPIMPGMNENIDARHLPIGTPRLIQNMRVRQGARFEKRPGTVELGEGSATGFPTTGSALFLTEHNGLVVAGLQNDEDRYMYTLSDSEQYWTSMGRHGSVVPERRFSISLADGTTGREHTCAAVDGTLYVAFTDTVSGATTTILAVDPGGTVLRRTTLATAAQPRLVRDGDGDALYLVYRLTTGAGTTLEVRTVTPSTLALSAATALPTTVRAAGSAYDVATVSGVARWAIAYEETANVIRVRSMLGTTSTVDATIATTTNANRIGIASVGGGYTCVAYYDGTTAVEAFVCLTSTLVGSIHAVDTLSGNESGQQQIGVVATDTDTFALVFGGTDDVASPTIDTGFIKHCVVTTIGVVGVYKIYHYQAASKPFVYGAAGERQVLIWAHNRNDTSGGQWEAQACHFVLSLERTAATGGGANLCAVSYEHIASYGSSVAFKSHLPEVADFGDGRLATVLQWDDPSDYQGLDVAVFRNALPAESTADAARQVISTGGSLLVSGGCLYEVTDSAHADTHFIVENGFPYAPEIAVQVAAGGSLVASQLYTFVACYRWRDAAGKLHRSAPSEPVDVTPSGGNLSALVRIATLSGTGRLGGVAEVPVAELYVKTLGGPYQYATNVDVTPSAISTTYTATAYPSSGFAVYTDAGTLANWTPSGARLVCEGGNRVFTVGWKERAVEFSKLFIPTAPWEFCDDDNFRIFVPEPVTALAYMDGTLVIFSERSIYAVSGDGPNDQNVGAFSEPRGLPATTGSEGPHVVETPQGLLYKAAGTIWLLPRGFGAPVPVGDDIQETLATYPYLRAVVLCANADDDCTHFVLATSDLPGAATVVAVWDNRLNAWSRDIINGDIGAAGSVDGAFTWLLPTWTASSAKPARYFDADAATRQDLSAAGAGTWIESRIGFGDWRPTGPLGWCRLYKLLIHGERAATCDMKLDVTVNAGSADAQVVYTKTSSFTSGGQFYREHRPHPEQGNSWRFDIYDAENSGKTAGLVLHSLAFEAEEDPGLMRLAESECF